MDIFLIEAKFNASQKLKFPQNFYIFCQASSDSIYKFLQELLLTVKKQSVANIAQCEDW